MAFLDKSKANFAFKSILGKAHTSTEREFANESIPSGLTIQAGRVWADTIDPVASNAVASGVVAQLIGVSLEPVAGAVVSGIQSAYRLKLGGSVPPELTGVINPNTGVAYAPNDYVGSVIPETMGVAGASDYRPILYRNGTEVPPLDASDWVLDPYSGVVVREGDVDSNVAWSGTMTMDCYVYIGQTVSEAIGNASGFTPLEGTGITVTPSGSDYIFSVDDYVSLTDVANISAGLQTTIDNIIKVDSIEGLTGVVDISGTGGVTISTIGQTIVIDSAPGYDDEQAQDAVGLILTNTDSVNFTYDDGTPQITADVVVDGDSLEVGVGGVRLKDTITGNRTFDNNLTVQGNLYVNGTEFIVNTQTVSAADNIILINGGEVGAGVTAGFAGIEVDRGTEDNYQFLFRESDDTFVVGVTGSLQAVATREDSPIDGGIAVWNDSLSRFDTLPASTLVTDADKITITQVGHSFVANNAVYFNGTAWALVDTSSDTPAAGMLAIVESVNGDDFTLVLNGRMITSGLTAGQDYYVDPSTPGQIVAGEPSYSIGEVRQYVGTAISTTELVVNISDGNVISNAAASISGALNGLYVNVDGDTMTGDLRITTLSGTGGEVLVVAADGTLQNSGLTIADISGSSGPVSELVIDNGGVISTQTVAENNDVDIGTEIIDSFAFAGSYSAMWLVSVRSGTNIRTSNVLAVWDGTLIDFSETSTNDLGDTTPVTLDVVINGANVELRATTTSDNWIIKAHRIVI